MHFFSKHIICKKVIPAVCFCAVGIIFFTCTSHKFEKKPACVTPDIVSFTNDVLPIFNSNCNISGCHTGSSPSGNLDLDVSVAYTKLMKPGSGYIDTVNPSYSLLYSQMLSTSQPMPPSGKLDECKTATILKWIQQRAKNN